jgi:hypothetical protein
MLADKSNSRASPKGADAVKTYGGPDLRIPKALHFAVALQAFRGLLRSRNTFLHMFKPSVAATGRDDRKEVRLEAV